MPLRELRRREEGTVMDTIKKSAKVLVLFFICSGFISATGAQEVNVKDLYLKNGAVTRCDSVWKGLGDYVWCNQGGNVKGYPASDVDMNKTFEIQIEVARLVNQSRDRFEDRDWDGAISSATAALTLDPENEVAYTNRAGAYAEKGLVTEAIDDSNKALNINPYYSLAYNNRGYAMERAGHLPQAMADYDMSCRMGNELACANIARVKTSMK
jgi:tetratricopeptide (TPR) repeat protein